MYRRRPICSFQHLTEDTESSVKGYANQTMKGMLQMHCITKSHLAVCLDSSVHNDKHVHKDIAGCECQLFHRIFEVCFLDIW